MSRTPQCDEVRPVCGVCRKGGRACTYTYGKATRFVECQKDRRNRQRRLGQALDYIRDDESTTSGSETVYGEEPQVVLSLRSSREAKSGSGLFQTFVPLSSEKGRLRPRFGDVSQDARQNCARRSPSRQSPPAWTIQFDDSPDEYEVTPGKTPDRLPSASPGIDMEPFCYDDLSVLPSFPAGSYCANEKLTARWSSLLGSGDPDDASFCPMYIFGDWVGLVAPHIKESEAVRTATACLMDSAVAYVANSEHNLNAARKSNAAALRTIRMMIQAGEPFVPQNDVLIAIKLLGVVEVCYCSTSYQALDVDS